MVNPAIIIHYNVEILGKEKTFFKETLSNVKMPLFTDQSTTNGYVTIIGETNVTRNAAPKEDNNGNRGKENSPLTTDGSEPGIYGVWSRAVGGSRSPNAKLLYGLICLSQLILFMSWSIIAPFFPPEAAEKGASPSQVGLIFGIYSLAQFVIAPVWGKLIPVIGARIVFISGYFVSACGNIAFGFFDRMPPGSPFVITSLIARAFQGLGTSAVFTSSMTMIAYTFPRAVGRLVGLLEVFTGIGLMIGPFIGGSLYGIGGYMLPFVSLGSLMIVQTLILIWILPADEYSDQRHKPGSFLSLLNIPGTWIGLLSMFLSSFSFTVLEPTLSPAMEQFMLSPVEIGLVFLLLGLVYGSTAPFFGWLSEKRASPRLLVICGNVLFCLGYIMLGPWPPLNLKSSVPLICVGIILVSIAFGLAFSPSYQDLLVSATFNGMPSNLSTCSVMSALFNSAYSLGSFLGPVIGGGLVQTHSFAFMASVIGLMNLILGGGIIFFTSWEFNCGKRRRKCRIFKRFEYKPIDANDEEVHLLSNERTQSH
ncbi:MFS-type transporter SLC18B1-like [Anneissia japonica]|uniref:MFS-type transporter SLC18B1-like n=1 Tax=Anneissia japonica TaxID=1529436 RepID=UPI001425B285|nr:MFS-type transporter SLC18B1-like [Anneissia japonica]